MQEEARTKKGFGCVCELPSYNHAAGSDWIKGTSLLHWGAKLGREDVLVCFGRVTSLGTCQFAERGDASRQRNSNLAA